MLCMALKYSVKYGRKYFKCFRAEGTPDVFALLKDSFRNMEGIHYHLSLTAITVCP